MTRYEQLDRRLNRLERAHKAAWRKRLREWNEFAENPQLPVPTNFNVDHIHEQMATVHNAMDQLKRPDSPEPPAAPNVVAGGHFGFGPAYDQTIRHTQFAPFHDHVPRYHESADVTALARPRMEQDYLPPNVVRNATRSDTSEHEQEDEGPHYTVGANLVTRADDEGLVSDSNAAAIPSGSGAPVMQEPRPEDIKRDSSPNQSEFRVEQGSGASAPVIASGSAGHATDQTESAQDPLSLRYGDHTATPAINLTIPSPDKRTEPKVRRRPSSFNPKNIIEYRLSRRPPAPAASSQATKRAGFEDLLGFFNRDGSEYQTSCAACWNQTPRKKCLGSEPPFDKPCNRCEAHGLDCQPQLYLRRKTSKDVNRCSECAASKRGCEIDEEGGSCRRCTLMGLECSKATVY